MNITQSTSKTAPLFIFRPEGCFVELSEKDFAAFARIKKLAEECLSLSGLSMKVALSSTYCVLSFHSFFEYLCVPTCCLSDEARRKIDQLFLTHCPGTQDIEEKDLEEMFKHEQKLTASLTGEELKFILAHEIGHYWLRCNFKAFQSDELRIDEEKLLDFKHDRALELACDLIAAKLTSPEIGSQALPKISRSLYETESEACTHPPLSERMAYISKWKDDPRLKKELTKELVLEMAGKDFQEAAEIYAKWGRGK